MTPKALAAIHRRCFVTPRAWSEAEFAAQLADPKVTLISAGLGFGLIRVVLDESELLTLAVDPPQQGHGHGRALLANAERAAQKAGAAKMLLEVSAENGTARALYAAAGFEQSGTRPRYYRTPEGRRVDAVLMAKPLNQTA